MRRIKKSDFLKLGGDIKGFKIMNPVDALPGITPKILLDLWDIGVKFGHPTQKGIVFKADKEFYMELYNFRETGGTNGFFVAKIRESHMTDEGTTFFELQNGMSIMWDLGFSASDIGLKIALIDKVAEITGDKIGDKRLVMIEEVVISKISVMTFSQQGGIMPVFPDMNEKDVLDDFDYPELLEVVEFGSLKFICLKSQKEEVVAGMKERMGELAAMGVTSKDVDEMSFTDLSALRADLSKRIDHR